MPNKRYKASKDYQNVPLNNLNDKVAPNEDIRPKAEKEQFQERSNDSNEIPKSLDLYNA